MATVPDELTKIVFKIIQQNYYSILYTSVEQYTGCILIP